MRYRNYAVEGTIPGLGAVVWMVQQSGIDASRVGRSVLDSV